MKTRHKLVLLEASQDVLDAWKRVLDIRGEVSRQERDALDRVIGGMKALLTLLAEARGDERC